ncbi:eukaryotic translation initiation factor 2B subunit gamma [Phyllostomus discolor]|uniref:Eukaryotic translation initiation factor 2B subunit gamma n=1 Tax=Phyllostomus discolor TaxID=89673 RepID=A0A834AF62_9CHIR|nr:eukaryotic translation initiation factor 2B subunit gamma [Phyllostomus discolor]
MKPTRELQILCATYIQNLRQMFWS